MSHQLNFEPKPSIPINKKSVYFRHNRKRVGIYESNSAVRAILREIKKVEERLRKIKYRYRTIKQEKSRGESCQKPTSKD